MRLSVIQCVCLCYAGHALQILCKLQDCLQYFKCLIEEQAYCLAYCRIENDSSQPVSWAVLSNYGHIYIIHLYTMEKHRRKGYSRAMMLCLMQ